MYGVTTCVRVISIVEKMTIDYDVRCEDGYYEWTRG